MNGRTEHKIKTENVLIEKIKDNKYYLYGFYNYLGSKYEHKTKELYINYVTKFLNSFNKNIELITIDDITEYLNIISYKEDKNGNKIETSGTYRATVHSALKLYFTYLKDTKKINNNIMENIPRPKNKKSNQINRVYLEPKEMQKMINNISKDDDLEKDRNLLIVMIFLYTGIRCTALTEINIEDFDLKNNKLSIIDKRNKIRTFIIDDDMISLFLKVKGNRESGALFLSNRKQRISQRTVSRIIEKNTVSLNKHITPHKLRHSYGTNLYKTTKDIYAVKKALGHENLSTTQIYIHDDEEESTKLGMDAIKKKINFNI